MTQYKLTYFNLRGRAELARLIFAVAGQSYEDKRIEKEDWPNHKQSAPFGQLPLLEVTEEGNKLVLAQSLAIGLRKIIKQFFCF